MIHALRLPLLASPEQIVEKSVYLVHADRRQRVSVAGPDSLAAMISLCRAGFDHVECARQATCTGADEVSDVLLIAGLMWPDDLAATLRRTWRLLRDGGVLVAQLRQARDDAAVREALNRNGVTITSTLLDLSVGCLVTHTIARAPQALRTAS